jgi:hypothetical protein
MYHVAGLTIDGWAALNLCIQFVLPLLVGLVTTRLTPGKQQALLLAGLTLIATIAAQVLEAHDSGRQLDLAQIVAVAIVNFIVSTLAHYSIWKPTGLSALLLAVFTHPVPEQAPAATAAPPATVLAPGTTITPAIVDDPNARDGLPSALADEQPAPRHSA